MTTRLNIEKAIQATGVLLSNQKSKRMSRVRLIKFLYIADRESIQEKGSPLTFDKWVAMDNGPVLSGIYDLIKGEHIHADHWLEYFQNDGYVVQMIARPPRGDLSRFDIAKLNAISEKYRLQSEWDMVEIVHEFPEWVRNKPPAKSSQPISTRDVLVALEMEDQADEIIAEMDYYASCNELQ